MLAPLLRTLIKDGALLVRTPGGRLISIGGAREEDGGLVVAIRDWATAAKIAWNPALAVGEAYMDGRLTIERGSLYELLALGTRNVERIGRRRGLPGAGRRPRVNERRAARRNVSHHYDLSGELYELFLDRDRQYSCGYFTAPGMSLDEAQAAKKRHLAAKLLLEPGHRVLDIGSGWGGLALTLAEEHGADVVGVTLSTEQLEEANKRAAARGLDRRVRFELRDYRDIVGKFDRIVSVGMFEHVGPAHYGAYFDAIARLLDDKGVAVLHTIGRLTAPTPPQPWFEKYIFPGHYLPALSEILPAIEGSGLIVADVEVLRIHYADTVRLWRERFLENKHKVLAIHDERFCRMWEFYLTAGEAGFRVGRNAVFQIQLTKALDGAPRTRDYITDFDRSTAEGARVAAE
jgi:cyclopropane-fatty-acyl-phospholipid synthase